MIELTEDQARAVDAAAETPAIVMDTRTNTPYVLLRKDVYERLKGLLYDDSEMSDQEMRILLARSSAANGWDEPDMELYDRYDEEKRKRCP